MTRTNVQPEAWHSPNPVNSKVGAGGDLNLSIPVLTVPGRGLNFDVSFSYKSSIKVSQRASWVGLGWNFDPGTITREVHGGGLPPKTADFDHFYGIDFPGSDVLTRMGQPDDYYAHLPGRGTTVMTRTMNDQELTQLANKLSVSDSVVENAYEFNPSQGLDLQQAFRTQKWTNWRIETDTTEPGSSTAGPVSVAGETTDMTDYRRFTSLHTRAVR
ncbi:MAG: hypothetical protein BRD45_03580 [Bacteroidetes bacterium QS_8_64_10]|nr:MAG: hypothetical protein BRD45_03580 [Bacteroidetes bacterium QS_8_64_10]